MLNRAGESIFWASNNENFINHAKGFSEGYFFQAFFAFVLANKAYNSFFFNFFYNIIFKKIKGDFVIRKKLRRTIIQKIRNKRFLAKYAKSIKKTFKFVDFFFSKVFFVSYYKYIIVTIKIFSRFSKNKKKKKQIRQNMIPFFWKFFFYTYFFRNFSENIDLKKII